MPRIVFSTAAMAGLVWTYWASIVLEAAPFVFGGTVAAAALRNVKSGFAATVIAVFAPGCDCAMNGFAGALSRAASPMAGFALTWSAACGPAALLATHAALGNRLLAARLLGGAVASFITALLWGCLRPGSSRHRNRGRADEQTFADHFAGAIGNVGFAAFGASIVMTLVPSAARTVTNPVVAAVFGALLSPCSTADAILARVAFADHSCQAAFIIAAQCVDIRQLSVLYRNFGTARTLLAALAGCAGCSVAALVAH